MHTQTSETYLGPCRTSIMELFPKAINSYPLSATHQLPPLSHAKKNHDRCLTGSSIFFLKILLFMGDKLSQTIYFVMDMVYSCKLSKSQHVVVVRTVVSLISLLAVDAKEVVTK